MPKARATPGKTLLSASDHTLITIDHQSQMSFAAKSIDAVLLCNNLDHAHFTRVLPRAAIALRVVFKNTPRYLGSKCTVVNNMGESLWRVAARFGFF